MATQYKHHLDVQFRMDGDEHIRLKREVFPEGQDIYSFMASVVEKGQLEDIIKFINEKNSKK